MQLNKLSKASKQSKDNAATKIQKFVREQKNRKAVKAVKDNAATKIQKIVRGQKNRKAVKVIKVIKAINESEKKLKEYSKYKQYSWDENKKIRLLKESENLLNGVKPLINENVKAKASSLKQATDKANRTEKKQNYNNAKEQQRTVSKLLQESKPDGLQSIYNTLNFIFNPIVHSKWKNILSPIITGLIIVLTFYMMFHSGWSPVFYVILFYIVLYLFFIHSMNIKMSCGKNTSLLEIFKLSALVNSCKLLWDSFTGNLESYTKTVNDYECFEYQEDKKFKRTNASDIKKLNTNFNIKLAAYGLNSNYPTNIPNKKYIFLSIYGLTVFCLLITSILDYDKTNNEGTTEQVINSIIVCLIFLIWTCVLDLPMWILVVIIIALILTYLLIGAWSLYSSIGSEKIDKEFLCKPYIIPLVNTAWAGVSFNDNLTTCINEHSNSMFLNMMKPYLDVINDLEEQVNGQNSKLNNLGNVVDMFQDKVKKMIDPIYNKIKHLMDKIMKIKTTIYDIFNHLIEMFKSVIWSLVNLVYAIKSINNILESIPFICFDENTILKTSDNEDKLIKNIKVGDILIDNSEVIGVLKSEYNNQKIYSYKNIIVTGDHFVYDNDVHKTVKECKDASLIEDYKGKYIYCLITSTQEILINDIIFSDYFDINNLKIQHDIQNTIISKLNNFYIPPSLQYKNQLPLWCFDKSTPIDMKDGLKKQIKDICIGEETYYGKVTGLVKVKVNKSNIYKIKDIITTGDQIIHSNGIWIRVSDKLESKPIDVNDNIFYHLSITTNKLLINNQVFTDFEQYKNYGYLEFKDKSLP
jgi:hypothetical protein